LKLKLNGHPELKLKLEAFEVKLEAAVILFEAILVKLAEVAQEYPQYADSLLRRCQGTISELTQEVTSRSGELSVSQESSVQGNSLEFLLQDLLQVLVGVQAELESGIAMEIFDKLAHLQKMASGAARRLEQRPEPENDASR
jgi:hypothetical protein